VTQERCAAPSSARIRYRCVVIRWSSFFWLLGALSTFVACGGSSAPPQEPIAVRSDLPREGDVSAGAEVEVTHDMPGVARALGPTATFADLVAAVRRLDDRGEGDSEERCVLRGGARLGDGLRLEAELAVPIRPVPSPEATLRSRLRSRAPVSALTVWGRRGSGALVLAVLTSTTARRTREVALFVGDDGARVRFLDEEVPSALAGPLTPEALSTWLGSEDGAAGVGRVLVTADAGLSLAALRRSLAAIPSRLEVALAVPLADDVRLPAEPPAPADDAGLCEGEPEWEPSDGEPDIDSLRVAIDGVRDDLAGCLARAAPERAQGGRLRLRFRVEPSGAVERACTSSDGVGDPRVRGCVLDVFRTIRTTPPTGGGAEVEVPLVLSPDASARTQGLCD
jgi:hypothetical protein